MSTTITKYGPFLVFFAALLWASDAPFRVFLSESLDSSLIVFMEHAIALVILLPFIFLYREELTTLSRRQWFALLCIGVGGSALALILFTESFSYMNPSVVILLQKLQPLIAIWLAVNFLREMTPRQFWLWVGVALVAAYVISFPGLVPQLYEGEGFNPHIVGIFLALSAAVLWGASTVLGRYVLQDISFRLVTALRFAIAFVFLLGLNTYTGTLSGIASLTQKDILYLVIISCTSGVVAMYLYYRGLSQSRASVATIAELGFPVGAVLINYLFLDAVLEPIQLLAMFVLLFAVYKLGQGSAQKE